MIILRDRTQDYEPHLTEESNSLHGGSVGAVRLELEAIDIHDEEEYAASLHVFQEPVAHPQVVAGSLYQPWTQSQSGHSRSKIQITDPSSLMP